MANEGAGTLASQANEPRSCSGEGGSPARDPDSSARILFLDDDPDRSRIFLARHPEAVWVQTSEECIARLSSGWDQVHLDHDLGGQIFVDSSRDDCGMEVVRWLCVGAQEQLRDTQFFIHSHNAEAAAAMVRRLHESGYHAVYRPFGIDVLQWLSDREADEEHQSAPVQPARPDRPGWLRLLSRMLRRAALPQAPHSAAGAAPGGESACGRSSFVADESRDQGRSL
jgi:hypothetical protein